MLSSTCPRSASQGPNLGSSIVCVSGWAGTQTLRSASFSASSSGSPGGLGLPGGGCVTPRSACSARPLTSPRPRIRSTVSCTAPARSAPPTVRRGPARLVLPREARDRHQASSDERSRPRAQPALRDIGRTGSGCHLPRAPAAGGGLMLPGWLAERAPLGAATSGLGRARSAVSVSLRGRPPRARPSQRFLLR